MLLLVAFLPKHVDTVGLTQPTSPLCPHAYSEGVPEQPGPAPPRAVERGAGRLLPLPGHRRLHLRLHLPGEEGPACLPPSRCSHGL